MIITIYRDYDKNVDKYTDPAKVKVIEIQVADEQLAKDLFERVEKGEDITKLARRYTQRKRSKRKGGELGPFARDKYGKMSQLAFKLEVGEFGDGYNCLNPSLSKFTQRPAMFL